jgi:hypothetical protein
VSLNLDIKYKDKIIYFYNKVTDEIPNIAEYISLNEIRGFEIDNNKNKNIEIFSKIFKDVVNKRDDVYCFNGKEYNYYDIYILFKKHFNFEFKNKVLCYLKSYEIDPDFEIIHSCTKEKVTLEKIKKLSKKPILCPIEKCNFACFSEAPRLFFKFTLKMLNK